MLAHFAGLLHGLAVHTSIKKLILITLFKCLFMAALDFHVLPCLMLIIGLKASTSLSSFFEMWLLVHIL